MKGKTDWMSTMGKAGQRDYKEQKDIDRLK
jgi:hypothetical protein